MPQDEETAKIKRETQASEISRVTSRKSGSAQSPPLRGFSTPNEGPPTEGPTPIEGPPTEGPTPIEGPPTEGPTPIEGPPTEGPTPIEGPPTEGPTPIEGPTEGPTPIGPPIDDSPPTDATPIGPPIDDSPPTDATPIGPPIDDSPPTDATPIGPPIDDATPIGDDSPIGDATPIGPPADGPPAEGPTEGPPAEGPNEGPIGRWETFVGRALGEVESVARNIVSAYAVATRGSVLEIISGIRAVEADAARLFNQPTAGGKGFNVNAKGVNQPALESAAAKYGYGVSLESSPAPHFHLEPKSGQ